MIRSASAKACREDSDSLEPLKLRTQRADPSFGHVTRQPPERFVEGLVQHAEGVVQLRFIVHVSNVRRPKEILLKDASKPGSGRVVPEKVSHWLRTAYCAGDPAESVRR